MESKEKQIENDKKIVEKETNDVKQISEIKSLKSKLDSRVQTKV
jgi:hypothetical protein